VNRAVVYLGLAVALAGVGLIAFPIVVSGSEQFDVEQEAGLLVGPIGLVVIGLGGVAPDPNRTTVGGFFGSSEAEPARPSRPSGPERRAGLGWSPFEPVNCRYCRTIITHDLARCPRCSRARDCRSCGRPLGLVLERSTCPRCARAEAFCNCPRFERPAPAGNPYRRYATR
jgi:hypothetical protein